MLLTDALRPPAGYGVDVAVGTTYSLDLTALLLAPLSFALDDRLAGGDFDRADPVRLLEAVRRYADRTTVFCQAGGIHVPSNYRSILTFVEDSVREVVAPKEGAIFHPKIWALRYVDETGAGFQHRVIVLSRNITFDRSWDTALVLDEAPNGSIDASPMGDFVSALPGMGLRSLTEDRATAIRGLADSLRNVTLAAPSPFSGGELIPIGASPGNVWPFPRSAKRLLAISPFLSGGGLSALAGLTKERTLVSRQESLELVGARALDGWEVHVMQRLAEVEAGEDVDAADPARSEFEGTPDGLHAKTFVLDIEDGRSLVVTGSANLTSHRWGNNVEFDVVLEGRTADVGVKNVIDGSGEAPGLIRLLEAASVENAEGVSDPEIATTYDIEGFHRAIAEAGIAVHVTRTADDLNELRLALTIPGSRVGETRVWPVSVPHAARDLADGGDLQWSVSNEHVTPFVAFETTAGEGEQCVTRRCVIKAELSGDVHDRRRNAVALVLRNQQDVLRYLVFLLGDPAYDALLAELAGVEGAGRWGHAAHGTNVEVALLEPLVRAVGRDEAALARIASAIDELRESDHARDLIPEGFDELWQVVWTVHKERCS
ncbi:phospholipase D family protein [Demequina capsici]|uniref:Phospholipase D family protein n=1 Tax=Demequina capsici TaxID=3075620 RepID=A0AA96F5I9_9MICO|nr:phospholipase D family protein [Demequina sp. OYTSA14]WNM23528.1 phospholipase D family protein [Demequina sp. OYTSA14]